MNPDTYHRQFDDKPNDEIECDGCGMRSVPFTRDDGSVECDRCGEPVARASEGR